MSFEKRFEAMQEIEKIVYDAAFYLPFWTAKYTRVLYHNNLSSIKTYEPLHASGFNDANTWYFDEQKNKVLKQAKNEDAAILNVNKIIDVGHNVKKNIKNSI